MLHRMREPVSGLIHLVGAIFAMIGMAVLYHQSGNVYPDNLALLIYGVSLTLLFFASGIYHLTVAPPKTIAALRKLDHAAIYLLIAGSYTPFCIIAFDGFWRTGFLALIWMLAFIGVGVKMFIIQAPRWVTAGVYVVMGWLSVFAAGEMMTALPASALVWLVVGGLIYTAGAVVYITKRMDFVPGVFGFHEVWHIFVLLGAAAHYIAILRLVNAA